MRGRGKWLILPGFLLLFAVAAGGCGYRLVPVNSQSPSPSPAQSGPVESPTPSAPTPQNSALQSTQRRVASGVVRLEVATCSATSTGSGVAIADDLVVTVAHVVDEAAMVRVLAGKTSRAGRVIGIDRSADVALVKLSAPLSGYTFRFAPKAPEAAREIGTLSYTTAAPLSVGYGVVTEVDKQEDVGGSTRYGLIVTDVKTPAGSSGGPLFDVTGAVLGLIESGPAWDPGRTLAISRDTVAPLVSRWRQDPDPEPRAECSALINAERDSAPKENYSSAEVQAAATLDLYFDSIARQDYATALAQFANGEDINLKKYVAETSSTTYTDVKYQEVRSDNEEPIIWVTYVSEQKAGDGPKERPEEICTRWSLDYSFARHNGLWLIDGSEAHRGDTDSEPC